MASHRFPKGNTGKTRRGERYDYRHQQERRRLTPLVNSGQAQCQQPICLLPSRRIQPGTPWALGHNDAGTEWIGPVHQLCNQRDAAKRGSQAAHSKRHGQPRHQPQPWHSRHW